MDITRRSFIRWVLGAGAAAACPFPLSAFEKKAAGRASRLESETWKTCHEARDGGAFQIPAPDTRYDVVIVGGGPSGLAAADELRDSDFVLLEKEDHVGGNAFCESWEGLRFSTGAAWTSPALPAFEDMAKRWKFDWKPIKGKDSACFNGTWIRDFWNGRADNPAFDALPYDRSVRESFRKFVKDIEAIDLEADLKRLDAKPFADFFAGYAPQLKAFWDGFGPSNWGADSDGSSAYVGLQAAKDWFTSTRYSWEGGMGMASQRLYESLPKRAKDRVTTGASVYKVQKRGRRAWVSFFQGDKARTIEARSVVMATPKFITRHLVAGLPKAQSQAMSRLRYAPYPVYNLCFDRVVFNQGYDNWVVGARNFTDFIPADWVEHADRGDLGRKQVLTVYAPRPESERADFLDDEKTMAKAEAAVEELLQMFPGWTQHLREVRVHRRGHPMPIAAPGCFTRVQPAASRDFPPIFFGHSDSKAEVSDFFYAASNGIEAAKKARSA